MYIERAQDRTIKGVYTAPQKGYAEEEIADDDPAVLAFLARQSPEEFYFLEFFIVFRFGF